MRKLGYLVVALGLALPAWCVERPASISGYVRNANGTPQMGAAVDVLGPAIEGLRVFTNEKGFFAASGLLPGIYSIKVSAPAFLPTLREKINVNAGANVLLNLTLSTLFDAVQFAPRRGGEDDGDWDWVLRSTANRPVLRFLPDGSVVVAKASPSGSDLKGTLAFVAGSPSQGFGSVSDRSTAFTVQKSIFSSDTIKFRGDVGYGPGLPNAVLRASYKHQMQNGSTPEVAFTMRRLSSPDLGLRDADLQALALSVTDNVALGDVLELKFGSELQSVQFMGKVTAARPFGSLWPATSATAASMTPSTTGPSARSPTVRGHVPSTTTTAPPATCTTKPCAHWATGSSGSCTAASATTPSTAKKPPGRIAKSPKPLDKLRPWDVYTRARFFA